MTYRSRVAFGDLAITPQLDKQLVVGYLLVNNIESCKYRLWRRSAGRSCCRCHLRLAPTIDIGPEGETRETQRLFESDDWYE